MRIEKKLQGEFVKAKTVKVISGDCIPTVPVGTEFEVESIIADRGYATCKGLPVSSVWKDEFVFYSESRSKAEEVETQ